MRSGSLTALLTDPLLKECREPLWKRADGPWKFCLSGIPTYPMGYEGEVSHLYYEFPWWRGAEKTDRGVWLQGSADMLTAWFLDDPVPDDALALYCEMEVCSAGVAMARWTFIVEAGDRVVWSSDIRLEITGGMDPL